MSIETAFHGLHRFAGEDSREGEWETGFSHQLAYREHGIPGPIVSPGKVPANVESQKAFSLQRHPLWVASGPVDREEAPILTLAC
ncbi:MAG: hypothetical protein ACYTFA_09600 [Planctomycetota bacterium]|jgi:hypothetical protein